MNATPVNRNCPLPIVPQGEERLSHDEMTRIKNLADRLLRDEPALAATGAFGSRVRSGLGPGPSLLYEDHSEISLANKWFTEACKYRIALLAGAGDLFAVTAPRASDFERYIGEFLALGRFDVIAVQSDGHGPAVPMPQKLAQDEAVMAQIVERAHRTGSLNIIPYVGFGGVWRLAAKIAAQSGAQVRVAAPPPRLARRVNDKLWFSHRVTELLGRQARPPCNPAFGPAALAGRLARLARSNAQVVIKVPDSAGSVGNVVVAAETIHGLDIAGVRDLVLGFLESIGWRQTFPLMVGVWEAPVIMSPSVQIWIPEIEVGPPVIEGMFTQKIIGDAGKYVGADRLGPGPPWVKTLAHGAMMLATLFQELGFFGRCSFDALIVGTPQTGESLHWIECNARWGAVSIPMTLVNRLVGCSKRTPFVAIRRNVNAAAQRGFNELLGQLDGHLFRPGDSAGVVLLAPGDPVSGKGLEFMAIAPDQAAAIAMVEEVNGILDA